MSLKLVEFSQNDWLAVKSQSEWSCVPVFLALVELCYVLGELFAHIDLVDSQRRVLFGCLAKIKSLVQKSCYQMRGHKPIAKVSHRRESKEIDLFIGCKACVFHANFKLLNNLTRLKL